VAKAASTEAFNLAREANVFWSRFCLRAVNRVSEYVVNVDSRLAKSEVWPCEAMVEAYSNLSVIRANYFITRLTMASRSPKRVTIVGTRAVTADKIEFESVRLKGPDDAMA
jgi:hypothetical protein